MQKQNDREHFSLGTGEELLSRAESYVLEITSKPQKRVFLAHCLEMEL